MSLFLYILRFGWPYLSKYKPRLIMGVIFGVLFGMTNALFPLAIHVMTARLAGSPSLFDTGLGGSATTQAVTAKVFQFIDGWLPLSGRPLDFRQIAGCLLLLPSLLLLRGIFGYLNGYLLKWINERIINDLRYNVIRKLHTLSLDFFHRAKTGDLLTRINGDTKDLYYCLNLGVSDLVKEPITVISILAVLLVMDWQLTFFVLFCLPAFLLPIRLLGKKVRAAGKGSTEAEINQATNLVENFHNIRVVKAFSLETLQEKNFLRWAAKRFSHNMRANRATELVNPIMEVTSGITISSVVLFIFSTGRSVPDLAAFLVSMGLFYTPIKKLTQVALRFQKARFGVERIQQTFKEQPSVTPDPKPLPFTGFENSIQFDINSFGYEPDRAVLKNIHFVVPKGTRIGLAGNSGSGKSSLINLIPRFYDMTEGSIKIDGTDIRRFSIEDLRSQIALVSQDILLFDATVAENIALGRAGMTREEIETAAKEAYAHEFIARLPHGYDTQIGEKAVLLSGGQKQRLSIARAFARNAPILLLDEATAALDSNAEVEVQKAIDHLSENRTVFCVAHRLSTLRNCQHILVLEHGRIIEQGSFQRLMDQNGMFSGMAKAQGLGQREQ